MIHVVNRDFQVANQLLRLKRLRRSVSYRLYTFRIGTYHRSTSGSTHHNENGSCNACAGADSAAGGVQPHPRYPVSLVLPASLCCGLCACVGVARVAFGVCLHGSQFCFVLFAWGLPSDFRPAVMTMGFKRLSASTTVDWMLNSTHLIAMVTTNAIEWYAPT